MPPVILITERSDQPRNDGDNNQGNIMSRRGMHPLLMGLDRPHPVAETARLPQLTGLESGQRKRYLRAEAEEEAQLS